MMDISQHLNDEQVIRYFLKFLPPRNSESILDIGAGRTAPYSGMLKKRCRKYVSFDIRAGPKVDIVGNIMDLDNIFSYNQFEWGWCSEVLEHIDPPNKLAAVYKILRVCRNVVFTFPTKDFVAKDKDGKILNSFSNDPGHTEVKIDWSEFELLWNVEDETTKNGRAIFILTKKDFSPPDEPKVRGYF